MSPTDLHGGAGGGQLHTDEEGSQDFPLSAQVIVTIQDAVSVRIKYCSVLTRQLEYS